VQEDDNGWPILGKTDKNSSPDKKCTIYDWTSGTGTSFKSGEGLTSGAKRWKKWGFFLVVPLHMFWLYKYISRFGERFRDGQYSLASFLFAVLLLTVSPPVPSHL